MRNIIIYTLILIVVIITISAIINGIEMNNTYGQYGKEIFKPSTFIIATMLSIWLITKLLQLLKSKKQDTNEITSLTSTHDKIITNPPSTKPSWFRQVINFLTFDTPTFRSVFDEGQRRVVLVLSFIIPFISSYVMLKDWEEGNIYYNDEFLGYCLISYLMYFVILLIYIWIREGSGNVRPGGNAGKSLWNMVKVGVITFVIFAAVAISFKEYEKVQEQKRIEEEKAQVIENTERFVSCLYNENIACMTEMVAKNKINEVLNRMEETFRDYDFRDGSFTNIYVERKNSYPMLYEVRAQLDYNVKPNKKKEFYHRTKNLLLKYNSNLEIIEHSIDE